MPEDQNEEQPPEEGALPQVRDALNRERERRQALEAENAALQQAQRDVAFLRAGVDLDSKVGQMLAKAYDGELDVEAIKTFAQDVPGALRATTTPPPSEPGPETRPDDGPTADEARRTQAQSDLHGEGAAAGQLPDKPLGIDIMDAAFGAQGGQRVRPGAGMSSRAVAAGLQVLVNRAAAGDPAAVFKRADETIREATERWRASQQ